MNNVLVSAIRDGAVHMTGGLVAWVDEALSADGTQYLIGVSGSDEAHQSMIYGFTLPSSVGAVPVHYIKGPLTTALTHTLSHIKYEDYSVHLGLYLEGRPYLVECNHEGSALVVNTNWLCSGTGRDVAVGVVAALWDTDVLTKELLHKAVHISDTYCDMTTPTYEYMTLLPSG